MVHTSRRWSRLGVVALPVALFAAACGGGKAELLKSQASVDLSCPVEQVVREELQAYVERVAACNRQNVYAYDHGGERWVSPLERASFDLGCPKPDLVATPLDNRSVGVSGCGKQAVYVLSQTIVPKPPFGMILQNSWVGNTVSEIKPPPP